MTKQWKLWRKVLCLFGKHEVGIFHMSRGDNFCCGLRCIYCGIITEAHHVTYSEMEEE